MHHEIDSVLRFGTGLAAQGATLTVYEAGTTNLATLYGVNDDTSEPLENPLTTDANGGYEFYVADGTYDLKLQYGNDTQWRRDIEFFDLSDAAGGTEIDDDIEDDAPTANLVTRSAQKIGELIAAAVSTVARVAVNRAALASTAMTSVPVFLSEGRRKGWFYFDGSDLSALVALDPNQGIYIAPNSDPDGSSGAWVRQFDGPVYADWFGLAGNDDILLGGGTNDGPKVLQILDLMDLNRTGNQGANALRFGPRGYFFGASTFNLRTTLIFEGAGRRATQWRWAADTIGFIVQRVNTPDGLTGAVDPFTVGGGDEAIIRQATLKGAYVSDVATPEGAFHAIALRARATLEDLSIWKFQGDGIFSDATAAGAPEGNANCTQISRVVVTECRAGLAIDGADTNVFLVSGCDFRGNRTWGVTDDSFLGNIYDGVHTAANGWDGAIGSIPTACHYLGKRYYVKAGQAAGASVNPPSGTTDDNTWWGYLQPGGAYNGIVAWVSGTVFREGGGFKTSNGNARNVLLGCYSEGDQNYSQTIAPTMMIGGFMAGAGNSIGPIDGLGVGPNLGGQADGTWTIRNNQIGASYLDFVSIIAGVPVLQSRIFSTSWFAGGHLFIDSVGGKIWFRLGGAGAMDLDADGLSLNAGKVYQINDVQVVGPRGAAVADATDAASAITQLNALLARCRAHGLIAP